MAGPVHSDVFDPSSVDDTAMADVTISAAPPVNPGRTASLSGTVFDDLNNDGVREPGEPGAACITIVLDRIDANSSVLSSGLVYIASTASAGSDDSGTGAWIISGPYRKVCRVFLPA